MYKKDFTTAAEAAQIQNPRGQAGNVVKYGVHITSDIEVTAYYMVNHTASRDIYTLKGKSALGMEFYVPMQHDQYYPNQASSYAGSADQIDIVASVDGTVVTVIPNTIIRVGVSGSAPANTAYTKTLNKGETLKIMEHSPTGGTLAGTRITATNPIAVSTTEDMVSGDTSGDQIVSISSLGKQYIVARGYMLTPAADRIYFVGTKDNTTLTIYNGGANVTMTINAGGCYVYNFSQSPSQYAVYVDASEPIYVYQRTGYNEQGAALLPSMYAISQNKTTYFQVNAQYEKGILVYREGSESGFTISYGSTTSALPLIPISIPNVTGWKCARFDLPIAANDQVVTISNPKGYFSFSYIAANYPVLNSTSFGYLTAFGVFRFPCDIIYKCPDATTTIEGGYASSYKWEYSTTESGTYTPLSGTGYSIVVGNEGYYKLTMNQDPKLVSDIIEVRNLDFQATIQPAVSPADVTTTFSATINPAIASDPNLKISYLWEFEGATQSNSTAATPTVTWNSANRSVKLTITAEANTSSTTGGCSAIVFKALPTDMDDCAHKLGPITCNFTLPGTTTYQWQSRAESSATWIDITGATTNTYTPVNQRRGITYYRPMVKDETNTVYSDPVKVRVRSCRLPVNHNISVMGYYD